MGIETALAELIAFIPAQVPALVGKVSATFPEKPVAVPLVVLDVVSPTYARMLSGQVGRHLVRLSVLEDDPVSADLRVDAILAALDAATTLTTCHYAGVRGGSGLRRYEKVPNAIGRDIDIEIVTITVRS
ncbi:MAG: hypothetical protein WC683_04980 [bacterium]